MNWYMYCVLDNLIYCILSFSEKAGCDDTSDFMVFHRYSDDLTFKLVGIVSEVLSKYFIQFLILISCIQ